MPGRHWVRDQGPARFIGIDTDPTALLDPPMRTERIGYGAGGRDFALRRDSSAPHPLPCWMIRAGGVSASRRIRSTDLSGHLDAKTPEMVDPSDYDLVVLAMQEPQYLHHAVRSEPIGQDAEPGGEDQLGDEVGRGHQAEQEGAHLLASVSRELCRVVGEEAAGQPGQADVDDLHAGPRRVASVIN